MGQGMGGGLGGCPRRMPFGRGILGTAASIVAGLALNDLANPDGYLRGTWRRIIQAQPMVRVLGYEATGKEKVACGSVRDGDRVVPAETGKED